MRAEVERFIARERLLASREPVWVAVSGGVDSMVLLHVLRSMGHPCSVVHVDHGLRGAESDGDRAFVEAYCGEQRLVCRTLRVDPHAHADAHGGSVQMAARALRYAAFGALLHEGPHHMALGHHADDAVETLLLHLMRGAGVHGWAAIPPARDGFVRPLLAVDRAAIRAYAEEHGVPFREDASNADPKYLRNRVRAEVLPLLNELRPGAGRAMARSTAFLRELETLAAERMQALAKEFVTDAHGIARLPFTVIGTSSTPLLLLRAWLDGTDFHPEAIDDLRQAVAQRSTGARFTAGDVHVTVDRDALLLERSAPEQPIHRIEDGVSGAGGAFTWRFDGTEAAIGNGNGILLDADRLAYPLVLRPWRPGDRMRLAGLGGSKLVSDLLIDAKVPLPLKARSYVLVNGEEVLWLVGLRMAEGTRPAKDAKRVLRVTA